MLSQLPIDSAGNVVQKFSPSGGPQTITVNGSAGAATLSAAINTTWFRVNCTVDTFFIFTVAGSVTAGTGMFLKAGVDYDLKMIAPNTKISVLAVGVTAGVCYLTELGGTA